ncbi:MAG: deoxyribonuclease V [Anaerolineae bacterium]
MRPDLAAVAEEQTRLAQQVRDEWTGPAPQIVAGVDMAGAVRGPLVRAAAVALSWPNLEVLAQAVAEVAPTFPYVPGFLAVREAPPVMMALDKLPVRPDLLMVDGHGVAHPRRFGIASYLGVTLDVPTIGVAKSRLVGAHEEPAAAVGAWTPLMDAGEVIGAVLRTKAGVKPIFVSVGHRVDLATAIRLTLEATRGHRLPEPTRLADRLSKLRATDDAVA